MRDRLSEELVLEFIIKTCTVQKNRRQPVGCTTNFIAEKLSMQRSNVSAILNKLYKQEEILKVVGKPVIYIANVKEEKENTSKKINKNSAFDNLIGNDKSLSKSVQQAKAAVLYPTKGLHTLILGHTGVGKTMFAEMMYKFAIDNDVFPEGAPFVSFNCADYASNPQLLLAQLFGAKKGSYTGAEEDRVGLVQKADGGILFLDEVHRLPPEGQEMFFYLMDKGAYKPLGDVGEYKAVEVLIICATTENVDSSLLSTFTRRIPMVISLPSLKDRTLKERFELIDEFFKLEAVRTNKEIRVTADSIKGLLLYNCIGNIGQLKNDIKLGCANGFLRCIVSEESCINVDLDELPVYVKKGLLNYKTFKRDIDDIIEDNSIFIFSYDDNEEMVKEFESESIEKDDFFYDTIEERINILKARGLTQEDINVIMSMDIDKHFKKYIYKVNQSINKEELSKVVDKKLISIVEDFLNYAGKELKMVFPQEIFYALCLHVGSSIERIKLNKPIQNHKIGEIIEKYPEEFRVSNHLADILEREYKVLIPKDEIGFITMFITEEFINKKDNYDKVIVLIAMHGNSTASSMADVVNKLIGGENTFAYDMPLDKSTEIAYEELKEFIPSINQGGGVLLLTDMGSLGMFGELISNETGIEIKTVDMVTTLTALEAARKALMGVKIDEIYNEIIHVSLFNINYNSTPYNKLDNSKKNAIITMCLTGEGSAVKLKNIVEDELYIDEKNIQVIPMSIDDREDILISIKRISKNKNILAIVGTVNPKIYGIPFISASELFLNKNFDKLKAVVNVSNEFFDKCNVEDVCQKIIDNFKKDIRTYDLEDFKPMLVGFIVSIGESFRMSMNLDTIVGLGMHLVCVIERLLSKGEIVVFKDRQDFESLYKNDLELLGNILEPIETKYNIKLNMDELCYIYSLIIRK